MEDDDVTIVEGLHGQALPQSVIRDGASASDDYGSNAQRSREPARRPFILSRWRRPLELEHTRSLDGGEILLREEGLRGLPAPGIGLPIGEMIGRIRDHLPDFGREVAVDATVIRSNSNGNRDPVSDPDAAWGVGNKSGARNGKDWVFGYKILLVADANCDAPMYAEVVPANESEMGGFVSFMENFLSQGFEPEVVIADRGYDSKDNSEWPRRRGVAPVNHLRVWGGAHKRKWHPDGFAPDAAPPCECGIVSPYLGTDPSTGERMSDGLELWRSEPVRGSAVITWRGPAAVVEERIRALGRPQRDVGEEGEFS